jgi:hypothetical protein
MSRSSKVLAHAVLLAALGIVVLFPALASAQPKPRCLIDVQESRCQATLCGPVGNYEYKWGGPGLPSGGSTQCVTVTLSGTYTLSIRDRDTGLGDQCTTPLKLEKCGPNQPPDCRGAHAKDALIWPPDHQMEKVEIEGITDPDGDPVLIEVFSITQDEPLNTEGDGNTCADAEIVDGVASVRAERTGDPNIPGNGRVYFLTFEANDGRGGRCKGRISVCVPHDMGQEDTCIDDGQDYDSLGSCPE